MKLFNFFSSKSKDYSSIDVGSFYDQHYDAFHKVYGEVIQAFRTNDLSKILTYQIEQIGIEDGFTILDADAVYVAQLDFLQSIHLPIFMQFLFQKCNAQ